MCYSLWAPWQKAFRLRLLPAKCWQPKSCQCICRSLARDCLQAFQDPKILSENMIFGPHSIYWYMGQSSEHTENTGLLDVRWRLRDATRRPSRGYGSVEAGSLQCQDFVCGSMVRIHEHWTPKKAKVNHVFIVVHCSVEPCGIPFHAIPSLPSIAWHARFESGKLERRALPGRGQGLVAKAGRIHLFWIFYWNQSLWHEGLQYGSVCSSHLQS